MSTHNICFHGEIRKISVLFGSFFMTLLKYKDNMHDGELSFYEFL